MLDQPALPRGHRHVVILGSVGVGKTFLANALGHLACQHGYSVRFLRADAMLRTLRQSRLDNSRDAEMAALATVDCSSSMTSRSRPCRRRRAATSTSSSSNALAGSMIVTSNRDTAEWLAMFDDVMLAQSAVDRFKNAAFDFVIEGESYRPRLKPRLKQDASLPPPARNKVAVRAEQAEVVTERPRRRCARRGLVYRGHAGSGAPAIGRESSEARRGAMGSRWGWESRVGHGAGLAPMMLQK